MKRIRACAISGLAIGLAVLITPAQAQERASKAWGVSRIEVSMARWSFRVGDTLAGPSLAMSAASGDLTTDDPGAGRALPEAHHDVGAQYRRAADSSALKRQLGAADAGDVDIYAMATKLSLGHVVQAPKLLVSVGARLTKAHPFGLAGFNGPDKDRRRLQLESGFGLMLRDSVVIGTEYRMKPDNIDVSQAANFQEEEAWDFFVAWFPWPHVNLTMGWVNQRKVAPDEDRGGFYLSGRFAY